MKARDIRVMVAGFVAKDPDITDKEIFAILDFLEWAEYEEIRITKMEYLN